MIIKIDKMQVDKEHIDTLKKGIVICPDHTLQDH